MIIHESPKKNCGKCKHLNSDGMFGMWCDIYDRDYVDIDAENCPNYEVKMSKRFIQVYLDLEQGNGCWNCKHDWSICKIHNIGTISFVKGVSHCKLEDWEFKR